MACLYHKDRELALAPGPFTDIGVGVIHACAIRVDGSAFCDGEHYSRRSSPPPTKFIQISGGGSHTCGITESSDIECWGSNVRGAPGERLSAPEGEFTAISIGWSNSCALRPDGRAVCWQQPDIQNPSELQEVFGGVMFEQPIELFSWSNGRIAVAERIGTIATYSNSNEPNAAAHKEIILDLIDDTICCDYNNGLLSAALDPQFEEFPFLYVYYTAMSEDTSGLVMRLTRFRIADGKAVRGSELTILDVAQPNKWRHGGAVRFGADGMLYLGIGDNDLPEKAQSLDTLLGKIIRIDVRGAAPELPYRIPPDNPFANNPDALPEIWAYGLRNPWRMDFALDGRLFIADVGNWLQEEVSLAAAGANLGWPLCEGNLCEEGVDADADGLAAPIFAYGREEGCAIIGGVTAPSLNNGFVFGDNCSRKIWLLEEDTQEGWQTSVLAQTIRGLLSFGIDADGAVYALTRNGPIMRLSPKGINKSDE